MWFLPNEEVKLWHRLARRTLGQKMLPALANHIRLCLEQIAHILEENQPQHRVLVFCGRYRPPQGVGSFPEGVFELLVGYVVPSLVAAVSSATGFKGYPLRFSELFNVTRKTPKCWATSVLVLSLIHI